MKNWFSRYGWLAIFIIIFLSGIVFIFWMGNAKLTSGISPSPKLEPIEIDFSGLDDESNDLLSPFFDESNDLLSPSFDDINLNKRAEELSAEIYYKIAMEYERLIG